MIYPVITMYQPWASWVAWGWKTIETRTHQRLRSLVGKTILIHASKRVDPGSFLVDNPFVSAAQIDETSYRGMPRGAIIAKAFVYEFSLLSGMHSSNAMCPCDHAGRYGIFLSNIQHIEPPIAAKGMQGIWKFDLKEAA